MRYTFFTILTLVLAYGSFGYPRSYADEYGERFYNQTPVGMADYTSDATEIPDIAMDDMAGEVQNIAPAAGDSDEDQSEVQENAHTTNENTVQ